MVANLTGNETVREVHLKGSSIDADNFYRLAGGNRGLIV